MEKEEPEVLFVNDDGIEGDNNDEKMEEVEKQEEGEDEEEEEEEQDKTRRTTTTANCVNHGSARRATKQTTWPWQRRLERNHTEKRLT